MSAGPVGTPSGCNCRVAGDRAARPTSTCDDHALILDVLVPERRTQAHDVCLSSDEPWHPEVQGYSRLRPDGAVVDARSPEPAHPTRVRERAHDKTEALASFLGVPAGAGRENAVVEVREGDNANTTVFTRSNLGGPRDHYLFVRGSEALEGSLADCTGLYVTVALCLFGSTALLDDGAGGAEFQILDPGQDVDRPVSRLRTADALTVYEIESATRLSAVVADLVSAAPPGVRVTVSLDLPRVHYYFFLFDAFEKGFLDPSLLLRWFDDVDARHEQVRGLVRRRLRAAVDARGGRPPRVVDAGGLGFLGSSVREHVRRGTPPPLATLRAACADHDPVLRRLMDLEPPATAQELNYLAYSAEVIRPAIERTTGRPAMFFVANPPERLTFAQADRLVAQDREDAGGPTPVLTSVHPMERIFTSSRTGRSATYLHDPGQVIDYDGRRLGPSEVVDLVHRPAR